MKSYKRGRLGGDWRLDITAVDTFIPCCAIYDSFPCLVCLFVCFRRWKRRAAILAEEKRRRKIRAEAALSTISVGPPLAGVQVDEGMVNCLEP